MAAMNDRVRHDSNDQLSFVLPRMQYKRLENTISFKSDRTLYPEFAFTKELCPNDFFNSIEFEKIGSVQVPLTVQDNVYLDLISEKLFHGTGMNLSYDSAITKGKELHSSKVLSISPKTFDISSLVSRHLDFPLDLTDGMDVKLEKVLCFSAGDHYHRIYDDSKETGSFGKVILQIPTVGGFRGGCLYVHHKERLVAFNSNANSHSNFYLTGFYSGCEHSMELITQGSKLVFLYQLILKNPHGGLLHNLPSFVAASKELDEILEPWMHEPQTMMDENTLNTSGGSHFKQLSSQDLREIKEVRTCILNALKDDAIEQNRTENVIFMVLQENYTTDQHELAFRRLRGKDKDVVSLLSNCEFLDVHLAVVGHSLKNTHNSDPPETTTMESTSQVSSYRILRWIDSHDTDVNLSMNVDWEQQCVGPDIESLSKRRKHPDKVNESEEHEDHEEHDLYYRHGVVFIWPKHQSYQIYCRYGIYSLVRRWERSLMTCAGGELAQKNVQEITKELSKIIYLFGDKDLRSWSKKVMTEERVTCWKLLHLCVELKAKDEGLALLKILGTEFNSSEDAFSDLEGIGDEEVARAIAKFVNEVAGWEACSALIEVLVAPDRICKQFGAITELGKCFLNANCVEGAKLIGNNLTSSFRLMRKKRSLRQLKDVICIMDFVAEFQADSRTCSKERINAFIKHCFSPLLPSIQCYLMLEMEWYFKHYLTAPPCPFLFGSMIKTIGESNESHPFIPSKRLIAMLDMLKRLGKEEWLQAFLSMLHRNPITEVSRAYKTWVDQLISSNEIHDLTSTYPTINTGMASLAALIINSLTKHLPTALEGDPQKEINSLLSLTMKFFMRLVRNDLELVHSEAMNNIAASLSELNVTTLLSLVINLSKSNSERLNNRPGSKAFMRRILDVMLTNMKQNQAVNPSGCPQLTLDTIKHLSQLDESFLSLIIQCICSDELKPSNLEVKGLLFLDILADPEICCKLDSHSKTLMINKCSVILDGWIELLSCKAYSGIRKKAFESKVINCLKLFITLEKNCAQVSGKIEMFKMVFVKLPLPMLLHISTEIYLTEASALPNMKKFPSCIEMFLTLCRLYFSQNFIITVCKDEEMFRKMLSCLIWTGDGQSWKYFADLMCRNLTSAKTDVLIRVLEENDTLQEAILLSPVAFTSFDTIFDYAACNPPVPMFPSHPEVEVFLNSCDEDNLFFSYTVPRTVEDVDSFAREIIEMGRTRGYPVSVHTVDTDRGIRCNITKERGFFSTALKSLRLGQQKTYRLLSMRDSMKSRMLDKSLLPVTDSTASQSDTLNDILNLPRVNETRVKIEVVDSGE